MEKQYLPVTNTQELTEAMARCQAAQKKFAEYTQEQVDRIFLAAATAANQMRIPSGKIGRRGDRPGRAGRVPGNLRGKLGNQPHRIKRGIQITSEFPGRAAPGNFFCLRAFLLKKTMVYCFHKLEKDGNRHGGTEHLPGGAAAEN